MIELPTFYRFPLSTREDAVVLPLEELEEKYEILHKLAEGGMGAIYKVRHRLLGETRVIKFIRPHQKARSNLQARFQSEARAAIALRHPNVAQVYDFSTAQDGTAYLVMEYIEGMTLQAYLARSGPPPLGLTLEIAHQTLQALDYLHQQGYVHRDIAPDNLMLTRHHRGGPWVKVIDLGLAKRRAGDLQLTSTGLFVGKVRYASPEQFGVAGRDPDPRSDLYSFGVVLYELLTGTCPIRGSSFEELIASHVLQPPLPFSETDPEGRVPEEVRGMVLSTLEKDPESRPKDAATLDRRLTPHRSRDLPSFESIRKHFEQAGPTEEGAPSFVAETVKPVASQVRTEAYPFLQETVDATVPLADSKEPGETTIRHSPEPRRASRWILGLAAAAALAWLLLVWEAPTPSPITPGPTGQGLLEAIPWAQIQSLVDAEGRPVPLPQPLHTPARIELEPGTYEAVLVSPDSQRTQTLPIEIQSGQTTSGSVDFGALSAEDYFESLGLTSEIEEAGT